MIHRNTIYDNVTAHERATFNIVLQSVLFFVSVYLPGRLGNTRYMDVHQITERVVRKIGAVNVGFNLIIHQMPTISRVYEV